MGIPQTEEVRRAYRELIVTTPGLSECVSGVTLCDETIHQQNQDGIALVKVIPGAGTIPGIKVDMSNYRACFIVFDCPSVSPVSFDAFHIRPTVKLSFQGRAAYL